MKLDELTAKARKHIAPSNFVFPSEKKYPIHDLSHAKNALARSSGKPEEAKVKAAVLKKYPQLKKNQAKKAVKASEKEPLMGQMLRASPIPIRLTENDNGVHVPNRVQLFKTGIFKKLQENGEWVEIEITKKTLMEIVQNFKNKVRGIDLAIDFSHRSDDEAAGWIKSLKIETAGNETQLWAEVDWTPDGHAALVNKKFRYLSPDFAFSYTNNETDQKFGATLFGAGLTNRPVIKNMAPAVELKEVDDMAKSFKKMSKEELETLLSETKDKTFKQAIQWRLDEMMAAEDKEEGDDEEGKPVENPNDESGGDTQDDEGNDDGDGDEAGRSVQAKKKSKPEDDMNFDELKEAYLAQNKELNDLKKHMVKKLAEEKAASEKAAKEASFTKLMSEGKVVEAQKEAFMSGDMVKFTELAVPVKMGAVGANGEPVTEGSTGTPAQDKIQKLAEAKAKEAKIPYIDAISLVLGENKDLATQYEKETTPTVTA